MSTPVVVRIALTMIAGTSPEPIVILLSPCEVTNGLYSHADLEHDAGEFTRLGRGVRPDGIRNSALAKLWSMAARSEWTCGGGFVLREEIVRLVREVSLSGWVVVAIGAIDLIPGVAHIIPEGEKIQ